MRRLVFLVALVAACSSPPPPAPVPSPAETPAPEKAIGTVRVTAATLNVRSEASASSSVIAQVRKGEKLALLVAGDQWHRVRLGNGRRRQGVDGAPRHAVAAASLERARGDLGGAPLAAAKTRHVLRDRAVQRIATGGRP